MDYEAMCYRCQELEKFDSEGEESSESASSQAEEEEEDEEGDRDASPTRKKKDPYTCDELSDCDVDIKGTLPEADTACPSCLKLKSAKRLDCACCGGECCQLCHMHYFTKKNHASLQNGNVICEMCYNGCDSEDGYKWHAELEADAGDSAAEE